jgi:hypothetical protein
MSLLPPSLGRLSVDGGSKQRAVMILSHIHPLRLFVSLAFFYTFCLVLFIMQLLVYLWSRGSSGNIVSDYGLNDRGSIPVRGRGFFFYPLVQIGSGAHPASYSMGTGGPFPSCKARPGRDADHSPPSSAEDKYE